MSWPIASLDNLFHFQVDLRTLSRSAPGKGLSQEPVRSMVLTSSLKVAETGRSIQAATVFLELALRRWVL